MLESIFNTLYKALYGNPIIAVTASFFWGVASVLLSPCHLSSIPLVIAVLIGKKTLTIKQTFRLSLVFSIGVLVSIAIIGIITALLGRMLGDLGSHANLVFGIALIIGGLLLLDIIPIGKATFFTKLKGEGIRAGRIFSIGLLFGLALGPCAFAFMAPVLTLAFSVAKTSMLMAVVIMLAYGIGHSLVITLGGASLGFAQRILNWNEDKSFAIIKKACAILVIAAGIYLIFR